MDKLEVKNIPIGEIKTYENNPRKIDGAVPFVRESIERYGFRIPIIVDEDGVIIAGHTRVEAAKQVGMTEVPGIVVKDLSEEKKRAFRLADNKTAEMSLWDIVRLGEELDEMKSDEFIESLFKAYLRDDEGQGVIHVSSDFYGELDLDEEFDYKCPFCGFEFNEVKE